MSCFVPYRRSMSAPGTRQNCCSHGDSSMLREGTLSKQWLASAEESHYWGGKFESSDRATPEFHLKLSIHKKGQIISAWLMLQLYICYKNKDSMHCYGKMPMLCPFSSRLKNPQKNIMQMDYTCRQTFLKFLRGKSNTKCCLYVFARMVRLNNQIIIICQNTK